MPSTGVLLVVVSVLVMAPGWSVSMETAGPGARIVGGPRIMSGQGGYTEVGPYTEVVVKLEGGEKEALRSSRWRVVAWPSTAIGFPTNEIVGESSGLEGLGSDDSVFKAVVVFDGLKKNRDKVVRLVPCLDDERIKARKFRRCLKDQSYYVLVDWVCSPEYIDKIQHWSSPSTIERLQELGGEALDKEKSEEGVGPETVENFEKEMLEVMELDSLVEFDRIAYSCPQAMTTVNGGKEADLVAKFRENRATAGSMVESPYSGSVEFMRRIAEATRPAGADDESRLIELLQVQSGTSAGLRATSKALARISGWGIFKIIYSVATVVATVLCPPAGAAMAIAGTIASTARAAYEAESITEFAVKMGGVVLDAALGGIPVVEELVDSVSGEIADVISGSGGDGAGKAIGKGLIKRELPKFRLSDATDLVAAEASRRARSEYEAEDDGAAVEEEAIPASVGLSAFVSHSELDELPLEDWRAINIENKESVSLEDRRATWSMWYKVNEVRKLRCHDDARATLLKELDEERADPYHYNLISIDKILAKFESGDPDERRVNHALMERLENYVEEVKSNTSDLAKYFAMVEAAVCAGADLNPRQGTTPLSYMIGMYAYIGQRTSRELREEQLEQMKTMIGYLLSVGADPFQQVDDPAVPAGMVYPADVVCRSFVTAVEGSCDSGDIQKQITPISNFYTALRKAMAKVGYECNRRGWKNAKTRLCETKPEAH